ncbi:related to circumsporozoite protein precursor [Phialocephala subalpina]|uniref:Related to circumsporozoite protein n=1 Tax=Phialocephala subalpina TaxID=576137 RepID=A0A1L7WSQ9_9HELO|nr:related to circumsporozoite protein precursor [Phialocephala subalpina]
MYTQALLLSALAAIAEARFGQEQVPIPAISALSNFGSSGQAATLAGQSISFLLAAANPCGKLQQADLIVQTLGTDPQVIAAARGLAGAEQNFNPFVVSVPSICSDASLPATAELRGVVPLVDPAVTGSDTENANAKTSLTTPFTADGLSVAEVMAAQGFSNFTTKALDGTVGGAASGSSAASVAVSSAVASATKAVQSAAATSSASVLNCAGAATTFVTLTKSAASTSAAVASASASVEASGTVAGSAAAVSGAARAASSDAVIGVFPGFVASTISGLDFGECVPTIKFEAGLNGRATTENTFQAIDPVVNKGQEEALNPNIITNRICDQLTNVCGANDAAKTACTAAKAQISALGTRDATTADAWNTALGFAGTNTNPDNAPQTGLVGHD